MSAGISKAKSLFRKASIVAFLCVALLASPLVARPASAQIAFGGMRFFTLTCTCSGNLLLYIQDYSTNRLLQLVYQPGASLLYSFYNPFATYMLGSYTPGAGICMIVAGPGCISMYADGMLSPMPGTGTSSF